jgi:hypothetical protein
MNSTNANEIANANAEAAFWVASEPARMGGRKVRMHATSLETARLEAQIQWEEWSAEDDLCEIEILLEQVGGDADGERSWICFEVGTTEELTAAARAAKV